jgi:hypothetical protein
MSQPTKRQRLLSARKNQHTVMLRWWGEAIALTESDRNLRLRLKRWERTHLDGHSIGTSDWPGWQDTIVGPYPQFDR